MLMAAFWFKSFLLDVDKLNIVYKIACYFMLYIKHIILLLFNCRCDSFVFRLPPRWSYKRFCLSVYIILFQLLLLLHIVAVAISSSIPFKFPAFPLAASAFLSFPSFYRNIICLCFFFFKFESSATSAQTFFVGF